MKSAVITCLNLNLYEFWKNSEIILSYRLWTFFYWIKFLLMESTATIPVIKYRFNVLFFLLFISFKFDVFRCQPWLEFMIVFSPQTQFVCWFKYFDFSMNSPWNLTAENTLWNIYKYNFFHTKHEHIVSIINY